MSDPDDMFLDDPLMAALLAPGTSSELAGEAAVLDAFRTARGTGNRRRHLRLITGAGGIVLALALSGGVAAAYTDNLPRPLQSAAHSLLGGISVPAPARTSVPVRADRSGHAQPLVLATSHQSADPRSSTRPHTSASPQPVVAPTTLSGPVATGPVVVVSPSAQPTTAPTRSPSPAPAADPVLSAKASITTVRVHSGLTMTGRLTRDGKPLADRTVYAVETLAGVSGSKRIATSTTAANGTVSLTVPALTRNATLQLVTGAGVKSPTSRITVLPLVTTKVRRTGSTYTATATAEGGQQGDTAVLQRYDNGTWVSITAKKLAADKTVTFSVPVPPANDRRYRVKVNATSIHGQALGPFNAKTG